MALLVIVFVSLLALKRAVVHVRVSFNITALTVVVPKSVTPSSFNSFFKPRCMVPVSSLFSTLIANLWNKIVLCQLLMNKIIKTLLHWAMFHAAYRFV